MSGDDWLKLFPEYVEVYAFMHNFMPVELCSSPNTFAGSAVELMAKLYDEGKHLQVAEWIEGAYAGKKIVGIATFIPEISAPASHPGALERGLKAIKLLIAVARDLGRRHPIRTIELVAGSRVEGVRKKDPQGEYFVAKRIPRGTAVNTLVERLKHVAADAYADARVFLSVEFEPGPLFCLGDKASLRAFCDVIESSSDIPLKSCVGVNLDIPHWAFLGGIQVEDLYKPEYRAVFDRIVHAHISDHHIGHFCDAPVGTFHSNEAFLPWMELLVRRMRAAPAESKPLYSGFVSCELEACVNIMNLKLTLETCGKLLDRI